MNATPSSPASVYSPPFGLDARVMTVLIPARWRAAILILGTVTLFPIIICVMMFNAVTYDMPSVRGVFRRMLMAVGRWFRISRAREVEGDLSFPGLSDSAAV